MSKLDLLNHPLCFHLPDRLTHVASWHEHIPFAMFLVEILRPGMIVELGAHAGDSYCAFCQAVSELGLETRCCAVDTWEGDPHSGLYGAEVLEDLRRYHDPRYGSFSSLIQSTFDEALQYFADGSIDLLHIDGYHTYEAVKHDLESWLPKLSPKAVLILHDTNVHEREFGSGRYWEEIKHRYPHFEFLHGHGLGVLAIGKVGSEEFQALLEATDQEVAVIRDFFFHLGNRLTLNRTIAAKESMVSERDSRLAARTAELAARNAELAARNAELAAREAELAARNAELVARNAELAERDAELAARNAELAEREAELNGLRSTLTQVEQREQILIEELRHERTRLVLRGYRFLRRLIQPKNQF